ncbi:hypothetical protein C3Y87_20590 [Carbonactinospora thermoautotrophica]|uniref:hypothetical protein n=1 Tax=Carbonactinospora thermoautotrophica TaxID=1469144 RepID=UPI00226FE84A|nr:hypothetical protein [Carbonactinospora thermoautotrophica]MCX9193734.1 hypothetical protein [Carbonactinospora thermoautotrophica]
MTGHGHPVDKQAFRAWVRAHHPDLGGDPETFAQGLDEWRTTLDGRPPTAGAQVTAYRRRRGLLGWAARWWTRRQRRRSRRLR